MKIAYVTPRYGVEVVGGAEHAARMLAERVHSQLSWDVEVFTSCALDAGTWQNELPPETVDINGVTVHRFATTEPRHPEFPKTSAKAHANPLLTDEQLQELWVRQQGPLVPDLIDALKKTDADLVIFYPYLYFPTVAGIREVSERAVMHPAAHDEVPIRMSIYAQVFSASKGFVFQTDAERQLVESLFPLAMRPQMTLGLGVEPYAGDTVGFRGTYNIGDAPYVLCLGRVDDGKGARVLARYFTEFKRRYAGNLKLVFAGPVMNGQQSTEHIIVTGPVSDEHKWGALRGARALISPSAYEAFSLVLLEAWAAEIPVLSNAACIATREHILKSHGGLMFDGYLSFEVALQRLLEDAETAKALANAGTTYVDQHFRWPTLIERYGAFLKTVADRTNV